MSAVEQLLPMNLGPWWFRVVRHTIASLFRLVGRLNTQLPASFFTRYNQMFLDAFVATAALYLAYQLRFDDRVPPAQQVLLWSWMLVLPISRPICLWAMRSYAAIWRYFNLHDALITAFCSVPPTILLLGLRFGVGQRFWMAGIPASVILIEFLLFVLFAFALRSLRRLTFELSHPVSASRRKAVLVGTCDSIAAVIRQVSLGPDLQVVGLLVPDAKLRGLRIGGFRVIDEPAALGEFLVRQHVDLVLISDIQLDSVGNMLQTAADLGAEVRLLPSATNIARGYIRVSALPKASSLVPRKAEPSSSPHPALVDVFRDKVVLITGAGGSIGSEISRQVSELPVKGIVLLDRDENAMFEIYGALTASTRRCELAPVVADIREPAPLNKVFARYRPDIVLHAAAYKHVPIMETNPTEAVLNNVLGTRELADAALRGAAERFVMISTDKAVNPTSIMGATKRTAEVLLQRRAAQKQEDSQRTGSGMKIACVRFGNVIGSRGSVVPIFLRQIAEGGPITITHEEMTRYFMTIPEAVYLVLQAATLASAGDVYMLDMGDPVKITDLATRLITLSGLQPGKDIEIKFVGVRPGEKIHEQLWFENSSVQRTSFPRVLAVLPRPVSDEFEAKVQQLEKAALARDDESVLQHLRALPIDFQGSPAPEVVLRPSVENWRPAASGVGAD